MHITHRHEVTFCLVLHHRGQQVVDAAGSAEEHLALAVLHIFLNIECDGFRHTKVFHVLGNVTAQLLGQRKEMVDGMARGEDNSGVVEDVHLLRTEVTCCQSLNFNKGTEHEFNTETFCNVKIGRPLARGFWL